MNILKRKLLQQRSKKNMNFIRKLCISTVCSALLSSSASAIIYEVRVNDSLNVRSEPSTSGRWVGSLSNRTRVDVTEVRGKWGRISNGWICLDYAVPISNSIQPRQYRVNVNDSLLFRSGPGQNNNVIGSFGNGTVLTINEICNNWGKTTHNGSTGWICLDYATPVQTFPPKQYVVSVNDCLRFRSGPNTDSSIIEELRNGTVLTIGEISNGWGKATHNNHSGWVCMEYMKEYHAPTPAPAPVSSQNKETANLQKEAAERARQEVETRLQNAESQVREGKAIIKQKDKTIEQQGKTIEEQKVLLAKLEKENEELKKQNEELKAQNALLSESIKSEHERGEAKCKEQEEKIAELKNQNKTLKDENDLLNKSVIEIEQLKQEIEEMCQK